VLKTSLVPAGYPQIDLKDGDLWLLEQSMYPITVPGSTFSTGSLLVGNWVNKLSADAQNFAGWHYGCNQEGVNDESHY
jgi:hypothetical protein